VTHGKNLTVSICRHVILILLDPCFRQSQHFGCRLFVNHDSAVTCGNCLVYCGVAGNNQRVMDRLAKVLHDVDFLVGCWLRKHQQAMTSLAIDQCARESYKLDHQHILQSWAASFARSMNRIFCITDSKGCMQTILFHPSLFQCWHAVLHNYSLCF